MIRKIIKIEEELCNGCGLCVTACHEGAIGLVDGKAKLLRDDYCDGLGNCLPVCPTGAISFEEREALEYNEEEVQRNMKRQEEDRSKSEKNQGTSNTGGHGSNHGQGLGHGHAGHAGHGNGNFGGCPGSRMMTIQREEAPTSASNQATPTKTPSSLRQWPVQIQLVPVNAPYFQDAHLLIAADCTAFAYGDFHQFMKNKITIIGCPKLDEVDYSEKLTEILKRNEIKSMTVIRMEVPCCGGIAHAAKTALANSGRMIPWRVITISTDGNILDDM